MVVFSKACLHAAVPGAHHGAFPTCCTIITESQQNSELMALILELIQSPMHQAKPCQSAASPCASILCTFVRPHKNTYFTGTLSLLVLLTNQFWRRQKRSHNVPSEESVDEPTPSLTGQHAITSPQHSKSRPRCGEEELFMQQALREILDHCMRSGQLPELSNFQQVCFSNCKRVCASATTWRHVFNATRPTVQFMCVV